MSKCELSGKKPTVKNLVSHSNIKTKKWCQPNIQKRRVFSESLNRFVTFKVANSTIRSIDHVGGFDRFILRQSKEILSKKAQNIQSSVRKAVSK